MTQYLSTGLVTARLVGPAAAWTVRGYERVTSTMDLAREAAAVQAPSGSVFVAEEQSAGRGRLGREWVSEPGGNLHFTVLLRVSLSVLRLLPMASPLAVAEAIDEITGLRAELKWPNDVQLAGKKCAGLLIDSQLGGIDAELTLALVGIGINVNRDPSGSPALREIATSIAAQAGRPIEREALLGAVLNRLASFTSGANGSAIIERWRARLNTLGRRIRVRSGADIFTGIAKDVGDDGSLHLATDDGPMLTLAAGEVTLQL